MEFNGLTSASHMSLPEAGYGSEEGQLGFGDIRGSVGRYDPWGIKATGFAVTRNIRHYAAVTIDKSIGIVLHQIREYIDHLSNSYTTRGVKFNAHLLESFLNKHIVMASDKDGGSLVVSGNAYVYEATAHMRGQLHGHDVYLRVGEVSEVSLWEDKAEEWLNKLKQVIMPFLPQMMLEFLQNFLDFQQKPRLPNFYLLAKTHKEGFTLKPNGRFPTRTVVGMFRWATTPSSILLATMGTMLLKIDRHHDPFCSPILDTLDLLKRSRKFSSDLVWGADGREWCISTFGLRVYTRISVGAMSPWRWIFGAPTFYNMNPTLYPFRAMNVYFYIVCLPKCLGINLLS